MRSSFLGPRPLPSAALAPMAVRITQRALAGPCIPQAMIARASNPPVSSSLTAGRAFPVRNAQVLTAVQPAELANALPVREVFGDPPMSQGEAIVATSYERHGQSPPRPALGLNFARRGSADVRTAAPIAFHVGHARPRPVPQK